jgi:signal peptidase I
VVLGKDEFFAMGDNRAGSSDSRAWGVLPKKDIIGHAVIRLFPIKLAGITPASLDDF